MAPRATTTELLSSGVDVTTVASHVGHTTSRMTLHRYAHALPAGDVAAAAVIGGLLPEQETDLEGSNRDNLLTATDEAGNEYVIEILSRAKSSG